MDLFSGEDFESSFDRGCAEMAEPRKGILNEEPRETVEREKAVRPVSQIRHRKPRQSCGGDRLGKDGQIGFRSDLEKIGRFRGRFKSRKGGYVPFGLDCGWKCVRHTSLMVRRNRAKSNGLRTENPFSVLVKFAIDRQAEEFGVEFPDAEAGIITHDADESVPVGTADGDLFSGPRIGEAFAGAPPGDEQMEAPFETLVVLPNFQEFPIGRFQTGLFEEFALCRGERTFAIFDAPGDDRQEWRPAGLFLVRIQNFAGLGNRDDGHRIVSLEHLERRYGTVEEFLGPLVDVEYGSAENLTRVLWDFHTSTNNVRGRGRYTNSSPS